MWLNAFSHVYILFAEQAGVLGGWASMVCRMHQLVEGCKHTLSKQGENCGGQLCVLLCSELIPTNTNLKMRANSLLGERLLVLLPLQSLTLKMSLATCMIYCIVSYHMLQYSVPKVLNFYLVAAVNKLQGHLH